MFKVLKVLYARDTKVSLGYWIFCEIGIDNLINLRQFDFKKAEIVTCSRSLTCILSRANGQLNQDLKWVPVINVAVSLVVKGCDLETQRVKFFWLEA